MNLYSFTAKLGHKFSGTLDTIVRFIFNLVKPELGKYLFATLINALSGILAALLIKHVHSGVRSDIYDSGDFLLTFFVYAVGSILLGLWGTYLLTRLSNDTLHDLRVNLSNKIMYSSYQQIELEEDKIIPIMTVEINRIGAAALKLADLLKSFVLVIVCLGYLIYLSWGIAIILMVLFSINFIMTFVIMPHTLKQEEHMKDQRIALFTHIKGMVNGLKELNFKKKLREEYTNQLISPTTKKLNKLKLKMVMFLSFFSKLDNFIIMSAVVIGTIYLNGTNIITPKQLLEFMILALFMIGPMNQIARFLRSLSSIKSSILLIEDLGIKLNAPAEIKSKLIDSTTWNSSDPIIQFQNVFHEYGQEEEHENFILGPLNFSLYSGKIVFVVGGNGSGKTTLMKILTGLYKPVKGKILYKNQQISAEYLEAYQDAYAAIFSDAHLFRILYHISSSVLETKGKQYIKLLEIADKVKIQDKHFSTIKLSYGQKKRLSLVMALLEDKEIYVFDEWAANQDPYFKAIFYDQILKELKQNGKTVIVISHDESYFSRADSILKFTDGQLSKMTEYG